MTINIKIKKQWPSKAYFPRSQALAWECRPMLYTPKP